MALCLASPQVVRDAIKEASTGRTCVIVSSKLSVIKDVDRIFVMQRGKVVEKGSHAELMRRQGVYHKLYTEEDGEPAAAEGAEGAAASETKDSDVASPSGLSLSPAQIRPS
ncbi:hypothetical protein V5799_009835 [Amblyomma americanum]|uniref:Uncharacterized protein n=1 Tax=Amblyomma americanum TaxID=6943 RepID=A0AAQ4F996_AMBAM